MKHSAQYFYLATFVFGMVLSVASPSILGQVDETSRAADRLTDSAPPTIFTDIELSPEGVVAIDSAGNQWIYDFGLERFVASNRFQRETGNRREYGDGNEVVDPVEIRCVEEKSVDYPALKAVYIGQDEYVDGDILAFGRVRIKGWVKGNVQSFNKTVLVTATGQVDGDIKAPEVIIKPGGVVLGEVTESPRLDIPIDKFDDQLATEGIWVVFAFTLALTLIVFLTFSLAPRQTLNMTDCARRFPARSFMLGFLFTLLIPAIMILVAVTVVGLLVVPIAYLVALAVGMAVSGFQIAGPLIRRHFGMNLGPVAESLSGVLMHMVLWAIVALLLGSYQDGSSGYFGFGIFLLVVAILVTTYSFFVGLGAVVLTRFGFRPYVGRVDAQAPTSQAAPVPAPPPIPEGPRPSPKSSVPPVGGPTPPKRSEDDPLGPTTK